jgi:3-phosphoshikimate 1-carboxyvinyltransferase
MKTINPFHLNHIIQANASKSDAQRCLILAAFANQPTIIHGLDESEDVRAMLSSILTMGAKIQEKEHVIVPIANRNIARIELNVKESGFALRTLALVGMALTENLSIDGSGSLLHRDQKQLCQLLEQLGFSIQTNAQKLPIHIEGSVRQHQVNLNGQDGSQVISGLFLLAPLLNQESHITIESLKSRPYLEMTMQRMRDFGLEIQEINTDSFVIPGNQSFQRREILIEGDWSGAANHLVGAAISGKVEISGLKEDSLQADRKILEILKAFGAECHWVGNKLCVNQSADKIPFETDISDCPDLFPILVILSCAANGKSKIHGVTRLKNKESDRLSAMCEMLSNFGIPFELESNAVSIFGKGSVLGGSMNTYHDHRIAMAGTIAACISERAVAMSDEECISKSYPRFFTDLLL